VAKLCFQKKLDIFRAFGRILYFAPESSIQKYIQQNEQIDYYTGDIILGRSMYVIDIQYKDNTFDYIICNHVTEHMNGIL